jgi:hypothetical protein
MEKELEAFPCVAIEPSLVKKAVSYPGLRDYLTGKS